MKVLMTGGAGAVGVSWVSDLLAHGHEILVYDNLSTGDRKKLPFEAKFVLGDVRDGSLLTRALKDYRPEILIHFAQVSAEQNHSRMSLLDHNISGLVQVLKAFQDSECQLAWVRPLEGDSSLLELQKSLIAYAGGGTAKRIQILPVDGPRPEMGL